MFGINIDPQMGNERFEYLIADIYNPSADKYPDGTSDENYYAEIWIPIKKKN